MSFNDKKETEIKKYILRKIALDDADVVEKKVASIPIKDACLTGEPVARSQARRICNRLDDFKEVIMDFNSVEFMGQGFADEIFRVYASDHPQVTLCPINMIPDVERMIRHVNRGQMSPNIRLEK